MTSQRMFHGTLTASALGDQLAARFNDRQHRVSIHNQTDTSLVQIGSKHGTPVSVHLANTQGGVLVTMSRERDWLDRVADGGEMIERAVAGNPVSLLAMVPDLIGELGQENLAPKIWDVINDICALSRQLAGEKGAPGNPLVCPYCETPNPANSQQCMACGGQLPVDLPRICPKCGRAHSSEALFCQACGTRLVEG
jgi:hypothetical protein